MKFVFKLLLATLYFAQPSTALAQSIYAIDERSPIIIKYDADSNLAGKKTMPAPNKIVVTALVDESGALSEQDVYSRRHDFTLPENTPKEQSKSAVVWLYFGIKNEQSEGVELIDDFRFKWNIYSNIKCNNFEWKNGIRNREIEIKSRSPYNTLKDVDPRAPDSAQTTGAAPKVTLNPSETLEFLMQCRWNENETRPADRGPLAIEITRQSEIQFIQRSSFILWTQWREFIETYIFGALFALSVASLLNATVEKSTKAWLYVGWLVASTIHISWGESERFFQFFFQNNNVQILLESGFVQALRFTANILFLFFNYINLGGKETLSSSPILFKLRKVMAGAMIFCLFIQGLLMLQVLDYLSAGEDHIRPIETWLDTLTDGVFSTAFQKLFVSAVAVDWVLKIFVIFGAIHQHRQGSKSARFILAAVVVSLLGNMLYFSLAQSLFALFFEAESLPIWARNIGEEPLYYFLFVVQALIMLHALFRRSKEIQESYDQISREKQAFIEDQNRLLEDRVVQRTAELQAQTEKTEKLMLNILPKSIADRLKVGEEKISDSHMDATILFSDLVGFTKMSSGKTAEELVFLLNDLFTRFDQRALSLGLEKIKTIGDAYMVAGGIPNHADDHAIQVVKMALGMYEDLEAFNAEHSMELGMRVGINSGPVVAGVIGHSKFSYDLWGNTVNTASRMESTSVPGKIQVSPSTHAQIREHFQTEERELIECKGLGQIMTYFVTKHA
jgi:class 3 adenylate cyclase